MIPFPDVVPGPDIAISASTYVAYRQCPDRALARLRGVYGPESMATFRGSLAHRVFARHLREGPIEDDRFPQACREEIGSSNLNHKMVDLRIPPSTLRGVIEEVRALYARFRCVPDVGFRGAEVTLEVEPSPGVRLVGTVDAVFDDEIGGSETPDGREWPVAADGFDRHGVRLVDWKAGALGEAQWQLDFYTLLWAIRYETIPVRAEAVSVQTGERLELRYATADLAAVARDVADIAGDVRAALQQGRCLDRVAGPWCRHCPLLTECEEGRAAVAVLEAPGA